MEQQSMANGDIELVSRKGAPVAQGEGVLPVEVVNWILDLGIVVSLVFNGCCTNAWSLEFLLKQSPNVGSALTFLQMSFISAQSLPSFITFRLPGQSPTWLPRLRPRAIPLSTWLAQVLLLVSMSLLNNWAFSYRVPITVQIIIRSSGLAMSMLFGYFSLHKTYTVNQIFAVLLVTSGVIIATLSGPSTPSGIVVGTDFRQYSIGISMLFLASILTGYYGMLQERTYARYGPHWKEGLFYTHVLSLPMFAFLLSDIRQGLSILVRSSGAKILGIPAICFVVVLNLFTQLLCTSSVNQLSSKVSSVTTNLVLTGRKALSLCISVWWFGNGWNKTLGTGASMVFLGTIIYSLAGSRTKKAKVS